MAHARKKCKCGCELIIEASVKDISAHERKCFKCGEVVKFKVVEEVSEEQDSNPAPAEDRGNATESGKVSDSNKKRGRKKK